MTPGEKIRQLREARGITQETLIANLKARFRGLRLSRNQLANWEMDRHAPRWEEAKALVVFFGITLDDLFFENRRIPAKRSLKLKRAVS